MKTMATGRISSFYMGMYPSACCRPVATRLATPDFDASLIGNIRATRCLRRCGRNLATRFRCSVEASLRPVERKAARSLAVDFRFFPADPCQHREDVVAVAAANGTAVSAEALAPDFQCANSISSDATYAIASGECIPAQEASALRQIHRFPDHTIWNLLKDTYNT